MPDDDEEQQGQIAPDAVEAPVDKVDPVDVEAVETEASSGEIRDHRFPFHKDFIDEVTGELRLNDRTELIDNGKSVPPPDGPQVRLSFPQNDFGVEPVGSSKLEEKLADLLKESIQVLGSSELREFMYETRYDLVFSFGSNGSHFIDPDLHVLAVTYLCLALSEVAQGKMDRVRYHAAEHRQWTFNWDNQFALTFVSCQPSRKDDTRSGMLENFREQYKEAQQAREIIDEQREEWLHSTAEPLLDEIGLELRNTSLPDHDREQLRQLFDRLRIDAYGYSQLVDTATAAEIANLSERSIRRYVTSGDLGIPLSSKGAIAEDEAKAFGSKTRPKTGRPPKE